MSYSVMTSSYSAFPTAPAAPHTFGLFGQSPRDNYAVYEEFRTSIRPSSRNSSERQRSSSGSSMKSGLKKLFGAF
ncbi:hypothetical protein EWM64_g6705 [Hericium alpestre]|uniref:Uncharacterized protein n=1 Tax=Hericium alpestre TaxID=135208 RepID=A0A4Y9ZSV3_9AGAM|nr:hypothetical protein EWM64_g6705 [Hericium alpestre]